MVALVWLGQIALNSGMSSEITEANAVDIVVAIKEADEMKRNITFIQCSLQAEFEDKLRRKATELYAML